MDYEYPIQPERPRIDTCPICGSDDTSGGPVEVSSYVAEQECYCHSCGAEYEVTYQAIRKRVFLFKQH